MISGCTNQHNFEYRESENGPLLITPPPLSARYLSSAYHLPEIKHTPPPSRLPPQER